MIKMRLRDMRTEKENKHMSNQIPEGHSKKWGRSNIVKKIIAENFTELLEDSKTQMKKPNVPKLHN